MIILASNVFIFKVSQLGAYTTELLCVPHFISQHRAAVKRRSCDRPVNHCQCRIPAVLLPGRTSRNYPLMSRTDSHHWTHGGLLNRFPSLDSWGPLEPIPITGLMGASRTNSHHWTHGGLLNRFPSLDSWGPLEPIPITGLMGAS